MKSPDVRKIWDKHLRQILFASLPMIFFGILSVNAFHSKTAEGFARIGGLIMVYAIYNLSRSREKYIASRDQWENARSAKFHKLFFQWDNLQRESLNLTFDMHASQIAQINKHLGQENPFIENDDALIEEFCRDIERRRNNSTVEERSKELLGQLSEFENQYINAQKTLQPWTKLIWRLEVFLLLWGSLQSTYGTVFYDWLKNL
ncbi:hypothetical protein [Celeribacter baekdonensis]|uniref:Uncharacterized protein n=1 Tax=Celeribacter baekdonensis TaxID=875171 RepID=A0A2R4M7W0_9RHOB|nr:hypothetical protein [Celeribacter baekdonensis]AVW93264.1 hypothetical protein DA792_21060 [Celeribacter baekdonensis]